jgi:hypothetical protein
MCEVSSLAGTTSHSGWVNPPLLYFWVSIINVGDDFLFCLLQYSVDQLLVGQCQSHLALRLTTRLEERYTSSCFTSNNEVRSKKSSCFTSNKGHKQGPHHHLYLRLTTRSEVRNHLALRLTTRSEAQNTSSYCFTSNNKVRSKESSCFMSNN